MSGHKGPFPFISNSGLSPMMDNRVTKLEHMYFEIIAHMDDIVAAQNQRIEQLELDLTDAERKIKSLSLTFALHMPN